MQRKWPFLFAPIMMTLSLPLYADAVIGNGTPQSCTEAALDAAMLQGGLITFNCGGPVTIPVTQEKVVNRDNSGTIIDGNNQVTLDGRGKNRIFRTSGGRYFSNDRIEYVEFTIKNMTLINGYATDTDYKEDGSPDQGGALKVTDRGILVVDNVTFENNVAERVHHPCDGGGAIYIRTGSVARITNSRFINNRANNGGAINNLRTDLLVTDSYFEGNKAFHTDKMNIDLESTCGGGGAIYIDGARKKEQGGLKADAVKLLRNTYVNNETNHIGGAIFAYIYDSEIKYEIADSYFEGNKSVYWQHPSGDTKLKKGGHGGAIYYQFQKDTLNMTLQNSTFVNNFAERMGGALRLQTPAKVINNTFVGNFVSDSLVDPVENPNSWTRGFGGAISTGGEMTEITNCTLVDNHAGAFGGAIAGEARVKNTIIAYNTGDTEWGIQQQCSSNITDLGGNIQFQEKKSYLENDIVCFPKKDMVHPSVGGLSSYGSLPVIGLLPNSPAIGIGKNCPDTDQLGQKRVRCDAGAVAYSDNIKAPPRPTNGIEFNLATGELNFSKADFRNVIDATDSALGDLSADDLILKYTFKVNMHSTILVAPKHQGKQAKMVAIALYKPRGEDQDIWLKLSSEGWVGIPHPKLSDLADIDKFTAETRTLKAEEKFSILEMQLHSQSRGDFFAYVGYAVNNTLVLHAEPIHLFVK